MHNYHDRRWAIFPADIIGPAGKPILSWRVPLLPYLEQDNVYKQLDLTKPWDDPRNAKLLAKMPDVFRVYGRDPKEKGLTYFADADDAAAVPGGPTPIHVPGRRLRLSDIADGTSNTIMAVVEAADAVSWARPATCGSTGTAPEGGLAGPQVVPRRVRRRVGSHPAPGQADRRASSGP